MEDVSSAATRATIATFAARLAMGAAHRALRLYWKVVRPVTRGVQAIPLTPDGRLVLVRLRYSRGWHLPGGGLKRGEDPAAALLRELREEIGLTAHRDARFVGTYRHRPNRKRDTVSVFVVRDVAFDPPRSLEIEAVMCVDCDALPATLGAPSRRALAMWRDGEG